ncbi:MAG: PQQ-binding-like beta-propeller repeat protein [Vicinamibacterales bacterium]
MKRLARVARIAAVVLLAFAAAAAALYWGAGVDVRLDGSGIPRIVREPPAADIARAVESHRAAQRSAPAAAPAATPPAASPDTSGTPPVIAAAPSESPPPAVPVRHPYWTGFRGPLRDGIYREQPILTSWPEDGLVPVWKQPIGGGYASFAIARGRAFTIEQRRAQEVVTAYDVATGREIWAHGWDGEFKEWMGGDGPRATPTWLDGRLYALGALGELRCLDERTGALVWRINILDDNAASNLPWGMAASPLVIDDLVVVLPGGPAGRSVVAYDRHTGARRWSALNDKQAYSAPMLATIAGTRQILILTATRLVAVTPEAGEVLWEYPWPTANDINASQPVILPPGNRVLLSSGYGHGAALLEVTDTAGRFGTRLLWEHTRLKNRFSSSVEHGGFIYGLDENILTCLDAATGDVQWKGGRYGHGQFVLASGHLVLLTEEGELTLVRATPERHHEVARFPVLEGKTWNHPAIDEGRLLVRNLAEMAAFDLRPR